MLPNYRRNLQGIHTSLDSGSDFVLRRAQRLLKTGGFTSPPFLPERLAPLQKVKRIVKEDLGNLSGLLLPLRDGFEIKINATHSPQRQNFSCAHEIAHTFFFEEEGKTLLEKIKKKYGEKIARKWEEDLCDIAASEMLMPSQIFTKYASHYYFGLRALTPLSRIFNTSITPTALRLCDINPKYCFVVHWANGNSQELSDLKLHATWLTWTRKRITAKAGRFVFHPKLFCKNSSISEAYMSDSPIYSKEWMSVGIFSGFCQIGSQAFDSGPYRFVISFIFPQCDN